MRKDKKDMHHESIPYLIAAYTSFTPYPVCRKWCTLAGLGLIVGQKKAGPQGTRAYWYVFYILS